MNILASPIYSARIGDTAPPKSQGLMLLTPLVLLQKTPNSSPPDSGHVLTLPQRQQQKYYK